jgi:puromycin-sensitive aminopeptidase
VAHDTEHRLDDGIRPSHYDVLLDIDLDAARFSGRVTIHIDVDTATDLVRLHAVDLEITEVVVSAADGAIPATCTMDAGIEQLHVRTERALGPGAATLEFGFTGSLGDRLVGLYRSTFTVDDADGTPHEHALAVTQFESTHARRAFPCFDEPAFKATFDLTVGAPADAMVLANTHEVERVESGDGRARTRFASTIPMSTYLVALVVGPLEASETRVVDGRNGPIPLRVVHRPGVGHLSGFALDVAEAALRFFEQYYDCPYPGDKVDLVAVPDFAFGAMENLGCITFREVLLLIDADDSTQAELQRVADVINHELAHMWFGDLVTMRWWNGLWLNEAFATFMEVTASDAFQPDWDCWTGFGLLRSAAFDTDSLQATRPIEYPVVTAADAEGMFDVLTYEKGASIVRMLEQYLQPERFRAGIAEYLRRHEFSNTDTGDLWDAIEATAGEPVRSIMDAWIFRGGHPEVTVEFTDTGVTLHQRRFRFDDAGSDSDEMWPIPMVVTTSRSGVDRTHRLVLGERADLDLGGPPDWIQPNTGGDGFFRTRLPVDGALALVDAGRPPLERFMLLDDLWAEVLAGRTDPSDAITLIERLSPGETNPAVWRRIAGVLGDVDRLAGPDIAAAARATARSVATERLRVISDEVARHGEPTDERVRSIRSVCFALAGSVGDDAEVQAAARQLFHDGVGDASLRSAATDVVARTATHDEHATIEQRWRSAANPQDELRYLHALADTPDLADLERTLELALSDVRPQNQPYLLRRALTNVHHGPRAWSFVTDRWSELTASIATNGMTRLLEGIRSFDDVALAETVEAFITAHRPDDPSPGVDQHLERMWVNVRAAERLRRVS